MSTLYGNDLAVAYARAHSQHYYPAGFDTRFSDVDPDRRHALVWGKYSGSS